jgi:uncharacterized membrane protein
VSTPLSISRRVLLAALLALVLLYGLWFARQPDAWVSLVVFALPPLLLALGVALRRRTAGFWSAVFALAWFSHGVLVAWVRPEERLLAWTELVLAVVVVFAASLPGLRARFAAKRR